MIFKFLFLRRPLPQGRTLEAIAAELGVSRAGSVVQKTGVTGPETFESLSDEAELQRRVMEAIRARLDSWLWLIAFISALASFASAVAAWVAVWKN